MTLERCDTKTLKFTIKGRAQAQARPRFARIGNHSKAYDTEASSNYKAFVKLVALDAMENAGWEMACCALSMTLVVYMEIPKSKSKKFKQLAVDGVERPTKKPDCSNLVKGIEDAIKGLVYKDDSQIVSLRVEKYYSEEPRAEVIIECIGTK